MLFSARPRATPAAATDADRARLFLKQHQRDFVGGEEPVDWVATRVTRHQSGQRNVIRLQQRYKGVAINGAEAVIHIDQDGIRRVRSTLVSGLQRIDLKPSVTRSQAETLAKFDATQRTGREIKVRGTPSLKLVDLARLRGHGVSAWQLAWNIDVAGPGVDETVWVDAHGGAVLHRNPRVAHALLTYITDNNETCPSNPPLTGYDEAADYSNAPPDVADAFTYMKASYTYFLDILGLDGLHDAAGGARTINALVGECADEFSAATGGGRENASWDRAAFTMRFGAAASRADDIVGHEYGHAVIDDDARFALTGQSGALAEAFADIFGELVDLRQATGNDAGDTRWAIGEDTPDGPYRNLQYPALFQQPEKISDTTRYYCGFDTDVAIHMNSGVLTHAFALLVDGGTFNGISVLGIDIDKATRIFYRALRDHLTSTATFIEAYEELLNAADDLIAEGAITDNDKTELINALNAVELHTPPCSTQLPYCPVGNAPIMMFYDGFENTASGNWANAADAGINHWNGGAGTPDIHHATAIDPKPADLNDPKEVSVPRRGHYGLWADGARDSAGADRRLGDSSVAMTNSVDVATGTAAHLQFESRFAFQIWEADGQPISGPEPDGGVFEYSTDGVTWKDAGALITAGQGYSGTIQTDYSNALAGRGAFVGTVPGYVSTQLDLTPLAGQRVRFRFRVGTDRAGGDIGWFVDDVAIYSCVQSQLVIEPAAGLETSEDGGTATFTVALAAMPTAAVIVSLTSSNPAEGTVEPSRLIFDSTDWNVPRTVTVQGVDDDARDGAQAYTVTVSISPSGDASFQPWTAIPITISNRDNETSARKKKSGGGDGMLAALLGLIHLMRRVRRRWIRHPAKTERARITIRM